MSNRIAWPASTETDVVSYTLERSSAATGPWTSLVTIDNDDQGVNYDPIGHQFFYVDSAGTSAHYYRLYATDEGGQTGTPSAPFRAVPPPEPLPTTVLLNHNYPTTAAMRYQTASGTPIDNAVIRIFKKSDFDQQIFTPQATTRTNGLGQWVDPVYLTPGLTYVVQFQKEGLYGPDHVEVVV